MSKFKFFYFLEMSKIWILELSKYSWNLQMVSIIEKLKNWKILLKNNWKIGTPFGRRSWKIGTPLAHWHAKLNNWHTFGTLARLLTRWQVIMRSCHAFEINPVHKSKTHLAQLSVNAIQPPNSGRLFGSFAFNTPLPIEITIFREVTVPVSLIPIIASFIFICSSSPSN